MTITITNPETYRDELATLFETELTGSGNPYQAVYGYEADDFGGLSPVLLVTTAADEAILRTAGEIHDQNIEFQLLSFVLYKGDGWTPADCEDALNLCWKKLVESIVNNQHTASRSIYLNGKAPILPANVGGRDYRMQSIPIVVKVIEGNA